MIFYRNKQVYQYNEIENPEIYLGINNNWNMTKLDFLLSGMAQTQIMWQKWLPCEKDI